jgi:uncharacterized membrane protein
MRSYLPDGFKSLKFRYHPEAHFRRRHDMKKLVSSAFRRFVRCFIAGLLAILPLVLTVAIVAWVAGYVKAFVGPETGVGRGLQSVGFEFSQTVAGAYAFGWAVVLLTIFLLGLVIDLGAKQYLHRLMDSVLKRIPLIGSVYGTSKQLVDMFDRNSEDQVKAMSVVFCTFGGKGSAAVLALMPSPERFNIDGVDYHVVIIPTAPVPFGGGLVFMPVDSVEHSEMSVDGLMSIYVSMGVTTPQFLTKDK